MRDYSAYEESHIITSRHSIRDSAGGDFMIPADAEVETKHHCVVYDSCSDSLTNKESKKNLISNIHENKTGSSLHKSSAFSSVFTNICMTFE